MVMPVYGKGKLAGKPIMDCQGLGMPAKIAEPEGRGGVPRIPAVARAAEGAAREDRLDPGQHHLRRLGHPGAGRSAPCGRPGASANIPYLANLVPGQFYEQALLPAAQQVVAGRDHRRAGRRARRQGRQGMARLQSGHRRELQEVGGRPRPAESRKRGPAPSAGPLSSMIRWCDDVAGSAVNQTPGCALSLCPAAGRPAGYSSSATRWSGSSSSASRWCAASTGRGSACGTTSWCSRSRCSGNPSGTTSCCCWPCRSWSAGRC